MCDLSNIRMGILGDDKSVFITDERHTIPNSAPYYVYLDEYPSICPGHEVKVGITQPAVEVIAGADAVVYEAQPNVNFGQHPVNRTGADGVPPPEEYRAFFGFFTTGFSGKYQSGIVTLALNDTSGVGGFPGLRSIGLHAVKEPWFEDGLTWNNKPPHELVAAAVQPVTNAGLYHFDITDLLNVWVETGTNYGLVAIDGNPNETDTPRDFDVRTGANPPKLTAVPLTEDIPEAPFPPPSDTYAIAKGHAVLAFHSSMAGKEISVNYWGRGSTWQRVMELFGA